jgi:anti-anti-sigma factor
MALTATLETKGDEVHIRLDGELDAGSALSFQEKVEEAAGASPQRLVIFMDQLTFMASAGLRVLIFAKQKMGEDVAIYVVGASGPVLRTLEMSGFDRAVYLQDTYEA